MDTILLIKTENVGIAWFFFLITPLRDWSIKTCQSRANWSFNFSRFPAFRVLTGFAFIYIISSFAIAITLVLILWKTYTKIAHSRFLALEVVADPSGYLPLLPPPFSFDNMTNARNSWSFAFSCAPSSLLGFICTSHRLFLIIQLFWSSVTITIVLF